MGTVRNLLKDKSSDIWSVSPDISVYDALVLMAEKDIGALLVLANDKLVGVFSERDYARKIILKGKSSRDTSVGEMMSKVVYYIEPDKTIQDCMALMTNKRIRHLPVMENNQLIGIVTIGDIVNQLINEQKAQITDLQDYIVGGGYGTT